MNAKKSAARRGRPCGGFGDCLLLAARRSGRSIPETEEVLGEFFGALADALVDGQYVVLPGFGCFAAYRASPRFTTRGIFAKVAFRPAFALRWRLYTHCSPARVANGQVQLRAYYRANVLRRENILKKHHPRDAFRFGCRRAMGVRMKLGMMD